MSVDRTEGRRAHHRAFRPTLDGHLEPRLLLTKGGLPGQIFLANPSLGFAFAHNNPPFIKNAPPTHNLTNPLQPHFAANTGQNGQKVRIFMDGGVWDVTLSPYVPALSPGGTSSETAATSSESTTHISTPGTVRAYSLGNGQVGIIVDGSTQLTDLTINLVGFPGRRGYAHSFAYAYAKRPRVLNIGALNVTSGVIGAIEGFHTADLSGPLTVNGTATVDRIAFDNITPGASINVGGTLNTLDIANGITLTGGGNIVVGNNLNLMNVGTDVNLSGGSSIVVGGTLGLQPQPAKGTGTGTNVLTLNQSSLAGGGAITSFPNVAAYIQGSLNLSGGSTIAVPHGIENESILFVGGNVTGGSILYTPAGIAGLNPNPPAPSYVALPPPPAPAENFVVTGTYSP